MKIPTACNKLLCQINAAGNGKIYIYLDKLYAFNAQTGKVAWSDGHPLFQDITSSQIVGEYLYISAGYDNAKLYVLRASDGREVKQLALADTSSPGALLSVNGITYYGSDNQLLALRGTHILWQQTYQKNKDVQTTTPIAWSQDTLFVETNHSFGNSSQGNKEGVYIYALDAYTGTIKWYWEKAVSDRCLCTGPVLSVDGKLYYFSQINEPDWDAIKGLWVFHNGKRDIYPWKG